MTDQPGSARFQALLESAVQAYEKQAGTAVAYSGNSLAMQLQRCHSVDDVAKLMHSQAQSFNDFRQRDRILKTIETTVSILSPISSVASVVRRNLKVLIACLISDRLTDISATSKGDTRYSWHHTRRTCRSRAYYVDILLTSK